MKRTADKSFNKQEKPPIIPGYKARQYRAHLGHGPAGVPFQGVSVPLTWAKWYDALIGVERVRLAYPGLNFRSNIFWEVDSPDVGLAKLSQMGLGALHGFAW